MPGDAIRSEDVRRQNLSMVLDLVRRSGSISRSQLVAATGLTRSAIGGLVADLAGVGLVAESQPAPDGSRGRPSPLVRIDDSVAAVAVEIRVDEVTAALVTLGGAVIRSAHLERRGDRRSVEENVADVVQLVARLGAIDPAAGSGFDHRIVGVGVAVAGLVRRHSGIVANAPNLGWVDVPIGSLLADALGLGVAVSVGNEADLGAIAESRRGAGVGARHMLFVYGEVGVGGAMIVDGTPIDGASGFAGEVGHIPVDPAGRRCRCGAIGCWETLVGERSLLERAGLKPQAGAAGVRELLDRAAAGDASACAAIDDHARWVAFGLAGLINVFDPDVIVLGGLLGRLLPFESDEIGKGLAHHRFRGVQRSFRLEPAALGVNATPIGAAELAFGPLLADPKLVLDIDRVRRSD